jgi:hypothetical protein
MELLVDREEDMIADPPLLYRQLKTTTTKKKHTPVVHARRRSDFLCPPTATMIQLYCKSTRFLKLNQ